MQVCSPLRLRCGRRNCRGWTRIDALVGEAIANIRWKGRLRSDHATHDRDWAYGWLPPVLQSFNLWVIMPMDDQAWLIDMLVRFYGFTENQREREMDMREMVDKVKRNEPLYGTSRLTPYMQGVASRNSRYAGVWLHIIPWFNFVNHDQVRLTYGAGHIISPNLS